MTIHYAVAIALLAASIPLAAQEPQRQPARPLSRSVPPFDRRVVT
jgi:hypothetical protein